MQRLAVELRAEMSGRTLVGYAAVYNQPTRIRDYDEVIAPGAFTTALRSGGDVLALRDHDPSQLLGRTRSGTLRLEDDGDGLRFEVDLPDTAYANDVRELVARGDLAGASFGFIPGKHTAVRSKDGRRTITHTSVRQLVDVSVVAVPAYEGTSVALRHFDPPADHSAANHVRRLLARHQARSAWR